MNRMDLELLKDIFKDDSIHFTVGQVRRVTVSAALTSVALECNDIFNPNSDGTFSQIVCTQSFDSIGMGSCAGDIPDPGDLVLIATALGDLNSSYAIKRLPSSEEVLPSQIASGHYVLKSKPGKKLYLASDTRVEIGKGSATSPATEPLILGNVLTSMLTDLNTRLASLIDLLSAGPLTISQAPGVLSPTAPALAVALNALKATMATDKTKYLMTPSTNIISQLTYTERGP